MLRVGVCKNGHDLHNNDDYIVPWLFRVMFIKAIVDIVSYGNCLSHDSLCLA